MREELHHLADQLPEAEVRPAPELIRGRLGEHGGAERDLLFFASFGADPDLAERHEEVTAGGNSYTTSVDAVTCRLGASGTVPSLGHS
ncbi:hypothetical protein [Streptosporangium roseum]|uniref:hypothetical protein n=1 Tax=Streptosporangium roseum TaxID=2001 RepID=UPI003328F1AB